MTTPYRNDRDALLEKKASIQSEIESLRAATQQLDAMRARQAKLARELSDIDTKLHGKRALPLLDNVKVASPCSARWDEMLGDERARHCLSCQKNVYNLSSMTREEAEAFLAARIGNDVCVRYYQRADGTIMTQDCSVGVSRKRRKKIILAVAGAGAAAVAAVSALRYEQSCRQGKVTMGEYTPVTAQTVPEAPPPPTVSTTSVKR